MLSVRNLFLIGLTIVLLSACSADKTDQSQKFYFLESLALVENAGRQLQQPGIKAEEVQQALASMDEGIKLAFQVESIFLEELDTNLPKFYQRYFVKGVEAYRLGIEAGISEDQKKGLELLMLWSKFWTEKGSSITEKLQKE